MESGEFGIKECTECFDAVDAAAQAVVDACADGKLNLLDVPKLLSPMRAAQAALKDRQMIKAELKDANEEEVAELVTRALRTTEKTVAAMEAIATLRN